MVNVFEQNKLITNNHHKHNVCGHSSAGLCREKEEEDSLTHIDVTWRILIHLDI